MHLAVAQWIVHMPPKRGIQVRFLSAGPQNDQNLSTGHVDKSTKVFVSRRFVWSDLTCLISVHKFLAPKLNILIKVIDNTQ